MPAMPATIMLQKTKISALLKLFTRLLNEFSGTTAFSFVWLLKFASFVPGI